MHPVVRVLVGVALVAVVAVVLVVGAMFAQQTTLALTYPGASARSASWRERPQTNTPARAPISATAMPTPATG